FRNRTKAFALSMVKLFHLLPKTVPAQILGKQVLRSGTSVAANYREACRARSRAEFISKIGNCEQEADETDLWLELLEKGCEVKLPLLTALRKEANEIVSILVTMSKRAKENE
ncbi:MAG: four helix bundle protein, partial [Desulfobacterales bacterium]|nr:four helix bundle protein [Desulfobacterales bacterium]